MSTAITVVALVCIILTASMLRLLMWLWTETKQPPFVELTADEAEWERELAQR